MSQFIFGEILPPYKIDKQFIPPEIPGYPFSFRLALHSNDFYRGITETNCDAIPFVISDSFKDNTAELLLRADTVRYNAGALPKCYDVLLAAPLQERVSMLVCALHESMLILHANECIIIFSDGTENHEGIQECNLNDLGQQITRLFESAHCFITGGYRIHI